MQDWLLDLGMSLTAANILYKAITIVCKIVFLLILWKVVSVVFEKIRAKKNVEDQNEGAFLVVRTLIKFAFLILGILFVISDGIAGGLQAVLKGSGVAAIALGIACQDTLGNFFSGLVILLVRPFKHGDTIKHIATGTIGKVEDINFRHTVIRTFENKQLIIPNSVISSSIIENATGEDVYVALIMDFNINYGSDLRKACALIKDIAAKKNTLSDVSVFVDNFTDTGVKITLRALVDATLLLSVKHDIYLEVTDSFAENDIAFMRSVFLKTPNIP